MTLLSFRCCSLSLSYAQPGQTMYQAENYLTLYWATVFLEISKPNTSALDGEHDWLMLSGVQDIARYAQRA